MGYSDIPVVDAWMQHPTEEFHNHEMFASLRRWQGDNAVSEIPIEWTCQAYEGAGVDTALISAWWGPDGPLLSNEYVADLVLTIRSCSLASVRFHSTSRWRQSKKFVDA